MEYPNSLPLLVEMHVVMLCFRLENKLEDDVTAAAESSLRFGFYYIAANTSCCWVIII